MQNQEQNQQGKQLEMNEAMEARSIIQKALETGDSTDLTRAVSNLVYMLEKGEIEHLHDIEQGVIALTRAEILDTLHGSDTEKTAMLEKSQEIVNKIIKSNQYTAEETSDILLDYYDDVDEAKIETNEKPSKLNRVKNFIKSAAANSKNQRDTEKKDKEAVAAAQGDIIGIFAAVLKTPKSRLDKGNAYLTSARDYAAKHIPKDQLGRYASFLSTPIGATASEQQAIEKFNAAGINTADDIDLKIAEVKAAYENKELEISNIKREISQINTTLNTLKRGGSKRTSAEEKAIQDNLNKLETKNVEQSQAEKELQTLRQEQATLEAVSPHFSDKKLGPEEVLIKTIQFAARENKQEVSPDEAAEMADELIYKAQKKNETLLKKLTGTLKPTLKSTLEAMVEVRNIGQNAEELKALIGKRKDIAKITEWIEGLGENKKKTVTIITAYLESALTLNTLSTRSRKHALELIRNLRKARNQIILEDVINAPELANESQKIKMGAYLKEINSWDASTIRAGEDFVTKLKKDKFKSLAKTGAVRTVGLGFGGIGFFAPEIFKGGRIVFNKIMNRKKDKNKDKQKAEIDLTSTNAATA